MEYITTGSLLFLAIILGKPLWEKFIDNSGQKTQAFVVFGILGVLFVVVLIGLISG